MDFEYIEHLEMATKVLNIAVFQPLAVQKEGPDQLIDVLNKAKMGKNESIEKEKKGNQARKQSQIIRLNSNPFFIDRDNFYSKSFTQAYGR